MEAFELFPDMAGTEEETRTRLLIPTQGELAEHQLRKIEASHAIEDKDDLDALNSGMDEECPPIPGGNQFRENGSRTYNDGYSVELATPEVGGPDEHVVYIKAMARLFEGSFRKFVQHKSREYDKRIVGIWQRRVIDSSGKTWGCHDNQSIQDPDYGNKIAKRDDPVGRLWTGFLYSRGFVTGALYISPDYVGFSQKLSVSHSYTQYGINNTLLRFDNEHGQRLELRCNDLNLSDWALLCRIGGEALVGAASQTGLVRELLRSDLFDFGLSGPEWNRMRFDKEHRLRPSKQISRNIAMQRHIISTILDRLKDYTDKPIPEVYRKIGEETLDFCDDMEAVIRDDKELKTLADRPDWAKKLVAVTEQIHRSPGRRRIGDLQSQLADLMYDRIAIVAEPSGEVVTRYGYGYPACSEDEGDKSTDPVEIAMRTPPNTRAKVRVHAAKRLGATVDKCDWHQLKVKDGMYVVTKSVELLRKAS